MAIIMTAKIMITILINKNNEMVLSIFILTIAII